MGQRPELLKTFQRPMPGHPSFSKKIDPLRKPNNKPAGHGKWEWIEPDSRSDPVESQERTFEQLETEKA